MNVAYNMDCMEAMRKMPDKCFDLAVVDPPYFENAKSIIVPGGNLSTTGVERRKYKMPYWIPPTEEYFYELGRVSKAQIIWGINYFQIANPGPGRIIWDKRSDNGTKFSDCEIAFCSAMNHVEIFRYRWNGMLQENMENKEVRIHPTQKPIALYTWIFSRYAKPGDKILDTHLGSGSSRIAAYDAGLDFTGFEIDKEYFEKQEERFAAHTAQTSLFQQDFTETEQIKWN